MMRRAVTLLGLGVAAMAFGWWGLNTATGRSTFDEMAGIIPLAIGSIGALAGGVALILAWRATRR